MTSQTLQLTYTRARVRANRWRLRLGGFDSARILAGRCGFFGNMFMTLNGIRLCEVAGVAARPYWGRQSLFYDPARGGNAWDYYFQPVQTTPSAAGPDGRQASFKPGADSIYPRYSDMGVRHSYHECIRRHVRLREEIADDLQRRQRDLFGGRPVLGVHMRFTDATAGYELRKTKAMQEYFAAVDARLERLPDAVIFAATDSVQAVAAVRERYGGRTVALDAIRSDSDVSIHGHYDAGVPGSPYQKGLDVVLDAHLLAGVDHLVRINSRVTAYSLCLNPRLTFTNVGGDLGAEELPWLAETR